MSEKSGLEMLNDIINSIALFDRRFAVIEQNTREILNRLNMAGKTSEVPKQEVPVQKLVLPQKLVEKPSIVSTVVLPSLGDVPLSVKQGSETTKVMGKLKNKENKVLVGVGVIIADDAGTKVKETKTNRAGEWMCFLPPGNYKASYFLENIIDTGVSFQITADQKILRVAQPQ